MVTKVQVLYQFTNTALFTNKSNEIVVLYFQQIFVESHEQYNGTKNCFNDIFCPKMAL